MSSDNDNGIFVYKHIVCKQSILKQRLLQIHIFFILQTIGCAVIYFQIVSIVSTSNKYCVHSFQTSLVQKDYSARSQSFVNQTTPKDMNNAISYFLVLLLFVHCTRCAFSFHPCCQLMSIKPSVPLLWQIQRFIYNIYTTTFCHGRPCNLSGILLHFGLNISTSTALTTNTSTTIVQNISDHCPLTSNGLLHCTIKYLFATHFTLC